MTRKRPLSLDDAPQPKKQQAPIKKLGLVYKANTKKRAYRFRVETIELLEELTAKVNKKTPIKISITQILELLIIDAHKNVPKVLSLLNQHNV
jgi:hypothetical protein